MSGPTVASTCRRLLACTTLAIWIVFVPAFFGTGPSALADEPVAEKAEREPNPKVKNSDVKNNGKPKLADALQERLPDGRSLRSIGISDSQKFELIPSNYSPVKQDQLIEAIAKWKDASAEIPNNGLQKAEYVVRITGDLMTCESGYLDIASNKSGWVSQRLGKVSFAVADSDFNVDNDQTAPGKLISLSDGNLIAHFDSQSNNKTRIPLKWETRGTAGPRGYSFDLRFPKTLETRFLFRVDATMQLEADLGVLRQIEGNPKSIKLPDASDPTNVGSFRWYEIDAGGLDSIRIRSIGNQNTLTAEAIVIRRNTVEYNIDSAGLHFIQRMEIGLPVGVPLPKLRVIGAKLTSIKVNASDASFAQLRSGGGPHADDDWFAADYQAISPPGAIGRKDTRVSLTLMGQTEWESVCNLPLAGVITDTNQNIRIVDACVRDNARVTIGNIGEIVDWELPSGWQRQSASDVKGLKVVLASGASLFAAFELAMQASGEQEGTKNVGTAPKPWSRLRLSTRPDYRVRNLWLRSEIGESGINCDAFFELQLNNEAIEPLRFLIQEGWEIESVRFPSSGRVIETPLIDERLRLLSVWPEGLDIDQPADENNNEDVTVESFWLRIQISGKRTIRSSGSRISVPATWMVRACDQQSRKLLSDDFTAAVIPPSDMNWSGDTAMMPHLVDRDRLTQDQRRFFGGEDRTTLYFKPRHRQIDVLGLESPGIDFQGSLSLQINRRDDEIVEQCFVKVNSLGRGLEQLTVHTGPAVSRPPFRWMIPGQDGSLSTTLAASDFELTDVDGQGIYTINVAGLDLSSRPLMAYRSYPAQDISTQLPSIPNAVSGTSQLYIGAGLEIAGKSKGVQLVPRTASPVKEFSGSNWNRRMLDSENQTEVFEVESGQLDGLHLRYDSVQKPSIELKVSDREVSMNLITHARTTTVASSRGSDRVETRLLASLSVPLTVHYDPEMQLASVTRDGDPIDLKNPSNLNLVLQPRKGTQRGNPEVIALEWDRNQVGFHVVRRCRAPRVDFDAAVLKHEYHLIASADTFAPGLLLRGNSESARNRLLEMSPGDSALLIRRNVLLAGGWLIAMINFIAFWCMMKRSPVSVFFCLAIMSISVLLWWPWRMTVIGWFVVPLIAAAMLVTARSWALTFHDSSHQKTASPKSALTSRRADAQTAPTTDFSWESMLKGWIIAIAVISPMSHGSLVHAQASSPGISSTYFRDSATTSVNLNGLANGENINEDALGPSAPFAAPVNVLIPMDIDKRRAGEFVYVPDSLHRQLFDNQTQSSLQSPAYASIDYLLKIRENDISGRAFIAASLLATLDLEFPSQWDGGNGLAGAKQQRQCLLPFPHDRIEKIQSTGAEPTKFRFSAGSQGGTVVVLPKSQSVQIQVALRLEGTRQGPWVRFELGVPAVSKSRIEVESDVDLRVLRVGGLAGRLIEEADLRRWSEVLGPTDQLDVSFRIDSRLDASSVQKLKPLQRRYWVSAGLVATTIDCEVDPPEAYAAGEEFQFVIRDSAMPILMSPDWRLIDTLVYAPMRRRINVMSVRDSPGPIQLLWKLSNQNEWTSQAMPSSGLSALMPDRATDVITFGSGVGSGNEFVPIRIPEVIATSLGENAPAWIALRCLDSLSFDPLPSGQIEPLSVDQFLAGWSGYRGRIDRAFVALDEIPTPRLRKSSLASSRIEDRHRLRVSPKRLELSYQADVTPNADNHQPYLLSIPKSVELVDLYVDEIRRHPFSVDSGGRRQVIIDRRDRLGEPFSVSAFAIGELSPGQQFNPPVMVLSNAIAHQSPSDDSIAADSIFQESKQDRVSSYTVSRTNDSFIQIVEPFAVDATRSIAALSADSLSEGYLPVATWKANSNTPANLDFPAMMPGDKVDGQKAGWQAEGSNSIGAVTNAKSEMWQGNWGGIFRVQQRTARFNCEQLIKLKRLDRDWQVSNVIHFPEQRFPDYVDIEIPTRWCDSLEISPATAWSRQPSTNASHQIVRVRCDAAKYPDQPLIVTGFLSQNDDGRVSVPTIRVLGSGKRTVYVQVPKRLTSELVQWRRVGVEETQLPRVFVDGVTDSDSQVQYDTFDDSETRNSSHAYRVIRNRWSIDLAPLPELSLEPIATAQDNQVFLADHSISVISHWDVSPGSLEKLLVSVPADAKCLGAWSGGVIVSSLTRDPSSVSSISKVDGEKGQRKVLEIPLSLSQLPQSVKIWIQVPTSRSKRSDYVPSLVGIPVTQAWLAIYQPQSWGDRTEEELSTEITKLRNLSLARSAVESIELAVDIVAERSSDEVVPWVAPWVFRYLQLASASGRTAKFSEPESDDPDSDPAELLNHSIKQFEEVHWRLLDRRIAVYANRFVPDLQSHFGKLRGLQRSNANLSGARSVSTDQFRPGSRASTQSESENHDDLAFLGDEAILSSSRVPGFRLDKVIRLASAARATPISSTPNTDHGLRKMLGNFITLILVMGLLTCLKPMQGFFRPLIVHPAFWLAALGVAGLFVAPSYVALSLVLVAISMPWFPTKQERRLTAKK